MRMREYSGTCLAGQFAIGGGGSWRPQYGAFEVECNNIVGLLSLELNRSLNNLAEAGQDGLFICACCVVG